MDEFKGIIFYRKNYREHDLIIKMLTDEFGKRTFFVGRKGSKNNRLSYGIQEFTAGRYAGRISNHGFSFINEVISADVYGKIYSDLEKSSYVQYIFSLVDSSFEDNMSIPAWFHILNSALDQIESGIDPEMISHAFELKLLNSFGVDFDFFSCTICGRKDLPLDLSFKYDGMLCQEHFSQDDFRFHLEQRMVKCLQVLTIGSLESIAKMKIDEKHMKILRNVCSEIYSNYVGIYPKTKSFIDKLNQPS